MMESQRPKHITLSQLTESIGLALKNALPQQVWVIAEVSECKVGAAGHCYLSLVERSEGSSAPTAEIRASIWAQRYKMIASYFRAQTGSDIGASMKILICCSVSYHPVYGLSLVISDIDPTYTVGQSERIRQLTIERLKQEGVFDMQQQQQQLPLVVQRLAVISSSTAAGYEDFRRQLESSPYRFQVTLFAAAMQGQETERSVIAALDAIAHQVGHFDVVIIIRGGGSASDLRWFDSYELASNVAQFPLPVLTGIGHEKDTSVTDMVSRHQFKTPTAVAAGLIDRIAVIDNRIQALGEQLFSVSSQRITGEQQRVAVLAEKLRAATFQWLQNASVVIERLRISLPSSAQALIERNESRVQLARLSLAQVALSFIDHRSGELAMLTQKVEANNPRRILSLGYCIALDQNGHAIKSIKQTPIGTTICIELSDGLATSEVINIKSK